MKGCEIDQLFEGTGREIHFNEGYWTIYSGRGVAKGSFNLIHDCVGSGNLKDTGVIKRDRPVNILAKRAITMCSMCKTDTPAHVQALYSMMVWKEMTRSVT